MKKLTLEQAIKISGKNYIHDQTMKYLQNNRTYPSLSLKFHLKMRLLFFKFYIKELFSF